ncbi:MAG: oxidoreductase [Candidatus Kariarchaeaceae archaeon]
MKKKWSADDIPDISGKIAIVTGANSGIGYHTVKELANKGATVVMACRDLKKGADAIKKIVTEFPDSNIRLMHLDLSSIDNIKKFSDKFKQDNQNLDLLINNAGLMFAPYDKTENGFELHFGINHLGHFALTSWVLDLLLKTENSRIVNVSSALHKSGKINFDDLQGEKKYRRIRAYSQSKLANLLFTYELQRKLESTNSSTISVGCHPGYAATNLQSTGMGMRRGILPFFMKPMLKFSNIIMAQSAQMGALPTLFAALSDEVKGGDYVGPSKFGEQRGHPKITTSSKRSHEKDIAKQLWDTSESLTGATFNL